ncbi:21 kDa protein-like [Primulina eburnea]|uniref:21 kDa protein-like n=1 Tax=Primulina eburnea TaxID=1245227 RepID=UPI003C6CA92C
MPKIALSLLLLLHILSAAYAATCNGGTPTSSGGLNAACKKLSNSKFCIKLLRPYASQFQDNDPHKMGHAAISATLSRAQAARAFMIRQITEPEINSAERAAIQGCLNKVGSSVDSLKQAARDFNNMEKAEGDQRAAHKKTVVRKIFSSRMAQNACYDMLNGAEVDGEVVKEVRQEAEEAAKASVIAQFFVK